MPVIIRHGCGEVLAVFPELPSDDAIERIHVENEGRCPNCKAKLMWKPVEITVKPLNSRRSNKS